MSSFFELSPAAQYFLLLVLIVVPLVGIGSYIRIRSGKSLRPKRQRYVATIVMQLIILVVTILAAHSEGIALLGRQWGSPFIWLVVAGYMALLAMRLRAAWAKLSDERKEQARRLLPDDPSLMRLWVESRRWQESARSSPTADSPTSCCAGLDSISHGCC